MGGYRGRAVKRIKGQRQFKPLNPQVKFSLTKTYQVSKGASTVGNTFICEIDASTPFAPINIINGSWTDSTPTDTEPVGLSSEMYQHYRHLVVKGCHVVASVVDDIDAEQGEEETVSLGQLSMIRTSMHNNIASNSTGPALKKLYGQKSRNFTLSSTSGISSLTKSAWCSQGYSAKKTWNCNANANDQLRVANVSGSGNVASDRSFISVCLCPRMLSNNFLQPTLVTIRISYIVQFQEPTIVQQTPMPTYIPNQRRYNKNKNKYRYMNNKASAGSSVAGLATLLAILGRPRNYRALRG